MKTANRNICMFNFFTLIILYRYSNIWIFLNVLNGKALWQLNIQMLKIFKDFNHFNVLKLQMPRENCKQEDLQSMFGMGSPLKILEDWYYQIVPFIPWYWGELLLTSSLQACWPLGAGRQHAPIEVSYLIRPSGAQTRMSAKEARARAEAKT